MSPSLNAKAALDKMVGLDVLIKNGDAVQIGKTTFVKNEDVWTGLIYKLQKIGFDTREADRPSPEGSLRASLNYERTQKLQCGHCHAIISALGCEADHGRWCDSCQSLIHLGISAEPGNESIFTVRICAYEDDVRLRLIDYDPDAGMIWLSTDPVGDRWATGSHPRQDVLDRQKSVLAKFGHLLDQTEAKSRLVVGKHLVHRALTTPVPAYRIKWPIKNDYEALERTATASLEGPSPTYNCGTTFTVVDGKKLDNNSFLSIIDLAYMLVPAFRLYPLETSDRLLNTVFDHLGIQQYSCAQGYMSSQGGYDPRSLNDQVVDQLTEFLTAFTSLDINDWKADIEKNKGKHSLERFFAMARFIDSNHFIRTNWYTDCYGEMKVDAAAKAAEEFLEEQSAKKVRVINSYIGSSGGLLHEANGAPFKRF